MKPYGLPMDAFGTSYGFTRDSRGATMTFLGVLPRWHQLKQSEFLGVVGSRNLPKIQRAGQKKKIAPKLLSGPLCGGGSGEEMGMGDVI